VPHGGTTESDENANRNRVASRSRVIWALPYIIPHANLGVDRTLDPVVVCLRQVEKPLVLDRIVFPALVDPPEFLAMDLQRENIVPVVMGMKGAMALL